VAEIMDDLNAATEAESSDEPDWHATEYEIHRQAGLAETAAEYRKRERPAADPLGIAGLPSTREGLDGLLADLCRRLIAAQGRTIKGRRLAEDLGVEDTRALRLVAAYGHVHHRIRQIVGIAGTGYCWGDGPEALEGVYAIASGQARGMGRAHFFLAAIYGKRQAHVELAQLCLNLVEPDADQRRDELGAMMAAEGVGTEELLNGMLELLRGRADGRKILRRLGDRHRDILLPADAVETIRQHLAAVSSALGLAHVNHLDNPPPEPVHIPK